MKFHLTVDSVFGIFCINGVFIASFSPCLVNMVNIVQFVKTYWVVTLVPLGFVAGCYFDRKNDENLSQFRNKSKLFQRSVTCSNILLEQNDNCFCNCGITAC